ncbi:MAG: DUF3570 domain-containing protein [Verrucomicrobiota bacterium]
MNKDRGSRSPLIAGIALLAQFVSSPRARAEDQVAYKDEYYQEDGNRINIATHSAYFEKAINSVLTLQAGYVYDGISGASPTGGIPLPGSNKVPLAKVDDVRNAGNVIVGLHLGNHTLSPQFSYSTENDYTSVGLALNDAITFNEKNTTLNLGISHDFDTIQPEFWKNSKSKDSTDALIGLTQLLDPRTYITVNATFGYSDGFLADPYKRFHFEDYPDPLNPDPTATFSEKRPGYKSKEILYLSANHFFDALNGSLEGSYRFYHDSYGINAQTVGVAWFQKIGKHLIISPLFRYYYQTAASFYATQLPGDPSDPANSAPIPNYYSADYRLSEMETFTYGLKLVYQINDHIRLDAAFTRYDMRGLDGKTWSSAYPKANVLTLGATWSF